MAVSRVLIYGGKGALGMTCVTYFKAKNWVSNSVAFFSNYCVVVGYTVIIFVYSSSSFSFMFPVHHQCNAYDRPS